MTTFQVTTPSSLNFAHIKDWPKCIYRFERYLLASGVNGESEEMQVIATWGTKQTISSYHLDYQMKIKRNTTRLEKRMKVILLYAKPNKKVCMHVHYSTYAFV